MQVLRELVKNMIRPIRMPKSWLFRTKYLPFTGLNSEVSFEMPSLNFLLLR